MKKHASGTAEGVAYLRFYESQRPEGQRICNDYMAYCLSAWWVKMAAMLCRPFPRAFMDWALEQKGVGMSGFLAVRTKMFDDFVLEQIKAGAVQYVILGAGLDSRPYRFADQMPGVRVFEVDHPLSQAAKEKRVIKCVGKSPAHVCYVPVDFTKDDLYSSLKNAGYSDTAKTVFTLEGVLAYLDAGAAIETLSFIAKKSGPGSTVLFDYVFREAINGKLKSKLIQNMKTFAFLFHEFMQFGIEAGGAVAFLKNLGFATAEDFTPDRLYSQCLLPICPERKLSDLYGIALGRK